MVRRRATLWHKCLRKDKRENPMNTGFKASPGIAELSKIALSADILSEVDFADKRKQPTTEVGEEIHSQFGTILKFAHFDYDKKKISFQQNTRSHQSKQERKEQQSYAAHIGNQKREN